jgi:hypothetical protein
MRVEETNSNSRYDAQPFGPHFATGNALASVGNFK